ncbi:histidine kinase [Kribbella sp. NPDC006257]|uniref:sensor histidine kinase n=1 Tax=Kribbella sp. NPDC006257 TaxID=3156738 RepID=UPI0033A5C891
MSIAVIAIWPAPNHRNVGWVELHATSGLFVAVPMLLGLWVFQRRALLVALRERAEQAERERDLRAERVVVAERRRIAREMHDVVAHRVSAIALQSGALTMTAPDEHTEQVAEVIRRTSTAALTELREILQVLREEQPGEPGHVAPSLGAVPVLVSEAASSGLVVSLELPDPVPEVAPAAGRAAYRGGAGGADERGQPRARGGGLGRIVELVTKYEPDLVLTDIQMPGVNGIERSSAGWPRCPTRRPSWC